MFRVIGIVWRDSPRALLVYLGASAISAASLGAALILLRRLINQILDGTLQWRDGLAFAVVLVLQQACASLTEREAILLRQRISARVNSDIQQILPAVPYSSFEDTAFQAEYGMLVREASFKPATLIDSILQGALAFFTIAAVTIALLPIMPLAGLVLLALLVPVMLAERRLRGRMLDLQTYHAADLLRMQYISQSSVDPDWQRDLRACGSDLLSREYADLSKRYLAGLSAVISRIQRVRFLTGLSSLVIFGVLFALVARAVARHTLNAADALTLVTGGYYLASRISSISASIGAGIESTDFMARVFAFIDAYPRPGGAATGSGLAVLSPGAITLSSVCYAYPRSPVPALRDVDMTIEPGVTAIIGANGAGKSTLVKILAGLISPSAGEVRLADRAGQPMRRDDLRVAVMFQHPAQLRLTVRQNVTMRDSSEPGGDDRVWEVLEEVGLADPVRALPQGLDSVLGGGFGADANLSGGQWQRLALARVLYRDAQLVILDEPSSHLDAEAESRLLRMLTQGFTDRMVVVVTWAGLERRDHHPGP